VGRKCGICLRDAILIPVVTPDISSYAEGGDWLPAVSRFEDVRDSVKGLKEEGCLTSKTVEQLNGELENVANALGRKELDHVKSGLWRLNLILSTVGVTDLARTCQEEAHK